MISRREAINRITAIRIEIDSAMIFLKDIDHELEMLTTQLVPTFEEATEAEYRREDATDIRAQAMAWEVMDGGRRY